MLRSVTARIARRVAVPTTTIPANRRSFSSPVPTRDPAELDRITTLSNGLRVATEAIPGHFAAVGVYIDAGSRYETERLCGCSHLVDRLAFKSTSSRSSDNMLEALESLGGSVSCASSRESIMYQSAVFNKDVATMAGLLAETIRDPLITDLEVSQQLETAAYEIQEIWVKPQLILPEVLHSAAYMGNTLGNPLVCPEDRLDKINKSLIDEYRRLFFRPDRMVFALAGVEHDTAVKLAEKLFGDMKPSPAPSSTTPPGILSKIPFVNHPPGDTIDVKKPAHFTGGVITLPHSSLPTHLPLFTQMYVAFEGLPIGDPDVYALATLQTLLGGGGSFSAGGPGKGMYSRLYTNVLNQYQWIESAVAFSHAYSDSGIFGIAASCHPSAASALPNVILKELAYTFQRSGIYSLSKDEVQRAKNQLKSSLLMNLESKMVVLEDLGRQVQTQGRNVTAVEMGREIDKLTVEDVRRVAERVLTGKVRNMGAGTGKAAIVVQADNDQVASMGDLQQRVKAHGLGRY
ncbi:hypothetical protein EX30DRAFT_326384 [Ascodesmis nigricans]|uniref:Mitochondrial-processing peptidase subunit alpha n=1 Tax=Ascodesmis nigricans TaxID=341454 RepID=A0A4S2N7J4_9PEZI|nr:hypothetical protein EX30DRAFT_326384 [Ascodesmis nigricans]